MPLARRITAHLSIAGMLLALAACAGPDDADAGCAKSTCHLRLREGGSVSLGGQEFSVEHVDDDSVTLSADHFGITLRKGLSVGIGKFHLTMGQTQGGAASVDVRQ